MAHRVRGAIGAAAILAFLPAPAFAGGAETFVENCQVCHGGEVTGDALPSMDPDRVLGDPASVIARVLLGSEADMDMFGFDSQGMPAFDRALDDAQIADLVNFLRARFSGTPMSDVTADQVATVRAELITD